MPDNAPPSFMRLVSLNIPTHNNGVSRLHVFNQRYLFLQLWNGVQGRSDLALSSAKNGLTGWVRRLATVLEEQSHY